MSNTTTLNRSPAPSLYLNAMALGTGVDAITGEVSKSALDPAFEVETVTPANASEKVKFRFVTSLRELDVSAEFGFRGSVSAPVDAADVKAGTSLDFSKFERASSAVTLIVLNWDYTGQSKRIKNEANLKLSTEGQRALDMDKAHFREKYGDYYVTEIGYHAKFTAVWLCSSETQGQITGFRSEIESRVSFDDLASASQKFSSTLQEASKRYSVRCQVTKAIVGHTKESWDSKDDVFAAYNNFRKVVEPVPYAVTLHHYSVVNTDVPTRIGMNPDVFQRLTDVFYTAQYVLFLTGIAPGKSTTRDNRMEQIKAIYRSIHNKRSSFAENPTALDREMTALYAVRDELERRLARQELLAEMRSLTYEDVKRNFRIESERDNGAWIECEKGRFEFHIGRTGFLENERQQYGIHEVECGDVSLEYKLSNQQRTMEFPGGTNIDGYIVGVKVLSHWTDGTNGKWHLPNNNFLGGKNVSFKVESAWGRGMHWSIRVLYIPRSEYDA